MYSEASRPAPSAQQQTEYLSVDDVVQIVEMFSEAPLRQGTHRLAFRVKRAALVSAILLEVRHDGTGGLRREPVPPRRLPLERTMKKVRGTADRVTRKAKAGLRRLR